MAQFRIGQRVRKVRPSGHGTGNNHAPIGAEGVIVGIADSVGTLFGYEWLVDYDGHAPTTYAHFYATSGMLEPLTDPAADAFVERIKRMEREPAPRKADEIQIGGNGLPQYPQIGSRT